jgi:hypothetical protein
MNPARPRRGIALVMALTLLALLGLAIAGGMAHTVASQRAATLSQNAATVDAAADRALGTVLGDANGYGLAALRLGETRTLNMDVADTPQLSTKLYVTRLAGGVLWMVAAVSLRADASAGRRVNLVARFPSVGALPPAAVVTRGTLRLGDGVRFTVDTSQDADCAAGLVPAAIVAPGADVHAPSGVRVDTADVARDSATYYLTQAQLASLSTASGVVHVAGDTTITGGSVDGILIVDGSLTLHGTFAATGLIVVRGGIEASDAAVTARGALLSFNASNVSTILTDLSVEYSPCVVAHVMRVALSPRVVRLRGWAELF